MFRPGRNIKISQAARALNVHRHTIENYLQSYKIRKRDYSQISDEELDTLVEEFKQKRPTTGLGYLRGHLLQQGWRIQRDRLLASIFRVDGIRKVLRKNSVPKQRKYVSSRPNAVWHIDGHHKLGPWGFIIHASIDGCDSIVRLYPIIFSRHVSFTDPLAGHRHEGCREQLARNSSPKLHQINQDMGVAFTSQGRQGG